MSLRHRQHRVVLIPQDDRPAFTRTVRTLGRLVDYDVSVPPAEMIGHFDTPGDPEALLDWLGGTMVEGDSLLVSIDMLAYGGHVASRQPQVRLDTALSRLDLLAEWRQSHPDRIIYALATIPAPRGMPLAARDVTEWRTATSYGRVSEDGASAGQGRARRSKARASSDFSSRYYEVRRRNLSVNLRAAELAADGIIDLLLISQESAEEEGPHIAEAEKILAAVAAREPSGSVSVVDGISQGLAVLLVRFVHSHMGLNPAIATVYSRGRPGDVEAAVRNAVRAQITAIGGSEVEEPRDADICLYVSTPVRRDISHSRPGTPEFFQRKHAFHEFAINLSGWVAADRLAALADAAFPGAADEALMQALHEVKVDLTRLGGFAARESLGATVGTALAQVCLRRIGLQDKAAFDLARAVGEMRPMRYLELLDSLIDSERAHIGMLFSRFAEDYLYQTRLRHRAAKYLADLIADASISLTEIASSAEEYVRTELGKAAGEFYIEHFLGRQAVAIGRDVHTTGLTLCELEEVHIELPWRRLAEVYVEPEFDIQLAAESPANGSLG